MTRLDKFVILLAFIVACLSFFVQRQPDSPPSLPERRPAPMADPPLAPRETAPPPFARVRRPLLGAPTPGDPISVIEVARRVHHSSGSAFPVHPRGIWMTARHVIDGCAELYLLTAGGTVSRATVAYSHPSADIALLSVPRASATTALVDEPLQIGQEGYSFGFPAGDVGAAHGQLMGRSRMQLSGRMNGTTPTLTWAELQRVPDTLESLGGISGGPMFDEHGKLIGVHVGNSARRGRSITVAPEVLSQMQTVLAPLALLPKEEASTSLHDPKANLASAARLLSQQWRIQKVSCRVW